LDAGAQTRPLDPAELWNALKATAGSFYSAGELARMWWADDSRSAEVVSVLAADELYFASDWRQQSTFRVKTPEQVARTQRQRAIMLAHPDLVGQLVVLRDSNNRPRVGFVTNASREAFEARVHNAKGQHYPADALLWTIAPWRDFPVDEEAGKQRLSAVVQQAKALQDTLVPFPHRQHLAAQAIPIDPTSLLPPVLPEGVTREVALLSVVLALAQDGARAEEQGLLPLHALQEGPLEMNQARQVALAAFPPEARLRKVGLESARRRLVLYFDFPNTAIQQSAEQIEYVTEQTGWEVLVNPQVNQQALGAAISEVLPPEIRVVKGPSFFMDRREVQIEVEATDDFSTIEREYLHLTGFRLSIIRRGETAPSTEAPLIEQPEGASRMEINAAYGLIRRTLEPHGLYKTSLKQGQIVLAFISPQVGERHRDAINTLAQQTGYAIAIHPHPNQQMILQISQQLIRQAGWQIRKGPGIHVDLAEVTVTLTGPADPSVLEQVRHAFEAQTGYRLTLD
jgi:hypothetical protein